MSCPWIPGRPGQAHYGTAVAAEHDAASGSSASQMQADFLDPDGATPEHASRQAAGNVSPPAPVTEAEFLDPDVAEVEPYLPPAPVNSAPSPATVPSMVSRKAPLTHDAIITSVEQPVNTAYESGPEEPLDVAGAGKAAPETGAPQAAPPPVDEKGAYDVLKSAFATDARTGALGFFKGKSPVEMPFAQAIRQAVEKNLSIRYSEKNYERSAAGISRAKALKDPVFSVSISGVQNDSFNRREYLFRRRFIAGELQNEIKDIFYALPENQAPQDNGQYQAIVDPGGDSYTVIPAVDGFSYRGAFDTVSTRGRSRTETVTASYLHQLPWGPLFTSSLSSKHNKTIFQESVEEDSFVVDDPDAPLNPDGSMRKKNIWYEMHSRYKHLPQRSWSSNMSLKLTVPVPYSKDWGPNGPAETPMKQAKVSQERAYWSLQSAVNSTLFSVNSVYWEVVRAARQLEAVTGSRKNLEQVLKLTEDLFKQARVTQYDMTSVRTVLAGRQAAEQVAWAGYVRASNALKNLLDCDKDAVIVPVSYAGDLAGGVTFQAADVVPIALENNPDLAFAKADRQAALVNLKFAHNQVRPDLKVSGGMTWYQTDSPFGYSNVAASWADLMSPDKRDGFVALNFRMPWGNRPAEDRLDQAEQVLQKADKNVGAVANTVARKVNDAVAELASAREQTATALKNMQLAEQVYKSVLDLWALGRVPELAKDKGGPQFAVLNKETDLLNARVRYISAQIGLKQAEGKLLNAQGLIAARYAEDLKITIKPVAEPESKEGAKPEAAKEKKEAEQKKAEKKEEPAK